MRKLFFYSLLALMCCFSTAVRAGEITVGNGTDRYSYVPFWSGFTTSYQRGQVIYEASELADMNGKSIHQMTFYLNTDVATKWGNALFKVYLAEVAETDFGTDDASVAFNNSPLTEVYMGIFSAIGSELFIDFDEPFVYHGGNLLLDIQLIGKGTASASASFYGTKTAAGGAIHGVFGSHYSEVTSVSQKARFIPKTTFAYGDKSTCTKPSGLVVDQIAPNSARILFTMGSADSYTLEYKPLSILPQEWTVIDNATTATVLNDLQEYTTYLVHLTGHCGEEVSQYVATSFSTPCVPKTAEELPYETSFEDVDTRSIPECWYKIANGEYPFVIANTELGTYAHTGSKALQLQGGTPITECMIIFPKFVTSYKELVLSFWHKNGSTNASNGYGEIGYITDMRFASTFTSIQTLDKVAEYKYVENVSLAEIPDNAYLAIRITGGTNEYSSLYIDDVEITTATPSCVMPTDLAISDITLNAASVSWTKGEADASVLEYKESSAAVWTVVENAVSPYALESLTKNTTYNVRVKNTCSELNDSKYITTSFTTLCGIFSADSENPYSENFEEVETGKIPDCWDNSESDSKWVPVWKKGLDTDASTSCVKLQNSDACVEGYNLLKTQFVHINSAATLSFNYKNPYHAGLEVWYSIDGVEAVKLDDSFTTQANWTPYLKALPAACTKKDVQIIFKGIVTAEGSSEWPESKESYLSITDLLIECEETCPKPNITIVGVSGGSVEVEWEKGGDETEWLYICQPKSVELVNWESAKTSTSTLVYVEGLEPLTDYVFYLRAKCSEEDQSGVVTSEFKTECGGAYKSYTTGFEASEGFVLGTYPECWTKMYVSKAEPEIDPVIATEGEGENVNQYLRVHGTGRQLIILPPFDKEIKDLQISFKYKLENNFNDLYVSFGTMSDLEKMTSFQPLSQQPTYTSNTAEYQILENFSLSTARSGDYYFAFFIQNPGGGRKPIFYLDNLVVEPAPVVPTAVENVESNVTAQKLMIDGQLYILHNGKIYTMQGQRVK